MKTIKFLTTILFMALVFVSCKSEEDILPQTETEAPEVQQRKLWPTVTWQIGVGVTLWKPRNDCHRGIGICTIEALFVVFDWYNRRAPINFGVTGDQSIIVEFANSIDIMKYMGQDYIDVEEGDEIITMDTGIIKHFDSEGIDISDISLVKGSYNIQYNDDTKNYYIEIPYEN